MSGASDINDLHRGGVSLEQLWAAAEHSDPVLGKEWNALATLGIESLDSLTKVVEKAQDSPAAEKAIVDLMGKAELRRTWAVAFHLRSGDVNAMLAKMRTGPRGVKAPVTVLERAIKDEAKLVAEKARAREGEYRSTVLDKLTKELGVTGLRCPGGWQVTESGVMAPDGSLVTKAPLVILGARRDADLGHTKLELAWRTTSGWDRVFVDRGVALNHRRIVELIGQQAPISSMSAGNIVRYLEAFEAENHFKLGRSVSRMGWVDDRTFLVGGLAIGEQDWTLTPSPGMAPLARGFRPLGEYDEWRRIIEADVRWFPSAMLGIYASCASALLRVLCRPGFIFEWSGESSHGKTTAERVCASVWGFPDDTGDGIINKWSAPGISSFMAKAWFFQNLPFIVDETKEGNPEVIARVMFSHASGQETSRARPDGDLQQNRRWTSVMISTGEAPITSFSNDQGARARCLCLMGLPFGEVSDKNKARVERITHDLLQHHGHLGPDFVRYLVENCAKWPSMRIHWEELAEELAKRASSAIGKRLMSHVAVLQLTAKILHEKLGLPGDPEDAIELIVHQVCQSEASFDVFRTALDRLFTWASSNEGKFWKRGDTVGENGKRRPADEPHGGWLGRWDRGDDWDQIGFVPAVVDQKLKEWGFNNPADVRTAWRSRKWIIAGVDKRGGVERETDLRNYGPNSAKLLCIRRSALVGEP